MKSIKQVQLETDEFYLDNEILYETSDSTTGDTKQQLDQFLDYVIERKKENKPIDGTIIDLGCGNVKRMTLPMIEIIKEHFSKNIHVVGIDRVLMNQENHISNNFSFLHSDITNINLPNCSAKLITAHWSVLNDLLLEEQQISTFKEISRLLEIEGEFYTDVPHLEGQHGFENKAIEFHKNHPDKPYGTIEHTFPKNKTKEFYIYPEKKLDNLFFIHGFKIIKNNFWKTKKGLPRRTIIAKLINKL